MVGTVKDERVKRGRRRVILFTVGVSAQRVYLDIRAPDGMQMCLSPQEIAQSQPPLTAAAIRQAVTRAVTRTSFLGVDSINLVSRQPWSVGGPPRGGNGMAASQCPAPWDAGVRTEVSVENLRMGIDAPGSDSLALRLLVTAASDEAIPADSRAIELRDVAVEGVQRQKPTLFLDRAPCPSLMPAHHPPSPPSSTDGSRSTLLHAKP
jgi:hypothetical protein